MLTPSLFSRHPPSVEHQSVPSVARHPPPSMSAAGPPPPGPPPGGPPGPSPGGLPDHTAARKRPASGEAGADVDPPWPSPVGAGAVGPPSPSLVGVPDRVMTIGGHSGIGVPFWMIDRIIRPAPDLIRPLTLIIDTRTVVRPGAVVSTFECRARIAHPPRGERHDARGPDQLDPRCRRPRHLLERVEPGLDFGCRAVADP